jgi:hypothetical protein
LGAELGAGGVKDSERFADVGVDRTGGRGVGIT